ncbi:MAG: glycosyltransferase [Prevotellaceae bacterium]|jgi:glycosyltransferase involved in cell wall biosynthesis|nr:glycosyltransferase [Prevotellaceae bacterium]
MNDLTVIIPFLNEGKEIKNTVQSIRNTAGNEVEILLINDCSTDGFDYKSIADEYNISYHENKERQGVAASRDIGVSMIKTPYFILIDGHMRFYTRAWQNIIIDKIKENDRAIYCFQCFALNSNGNKLHDRHGFGAFIMFDGNYFNEILEAKWITKENAITDPIIEIPCLLGASYSTSKRYWNYIKGLNGLRYYGSDEVYLSLKVWLEGGKCILIKDVEVGHLFRTKPPYELILPDSMYNKLFVIKTVLFDESEKLQDNLQKMFPAEYFLAKATMSKEKDKIEEYKLYYQKIFTRDINTFKKLNKTKLDNLDSQDILSEKLKEIYNSLIMSKPKQAGLMLGEMGELIFLYEYVNYMQYPQMIDAVNKKFLSFLKRCVSDMTHYNLYCGAAGIGIGLDYLIRKKYVDFDDKKYFSDIEIAMEEFIENELNSGHIGFFEQSLGVEYYFSKKNKYNFSRQELIINAIIKNLSFNKNNAASNNIIDALSFLIYIWKLGFQNGKIKQCIDLCINYIKNNINEKKLIYKSGDLISNFTLLKAAIALSDEVLYKEIETKILFTCKRQDAIREYVWDASLQVGSSGTFLIYLLTYIYTHNESIKDAATYWAKDIIYKDTHTKENAGFLSYNFKIQDYNSSFMHGTAGIGMTTLTMLSGQIPDWSEILML